MRALVATLLFFSVACYASVIGVLPRQPVPAQMPKDLEKIGLITDDKGLLCTGTLIGPNVVLTAAHCLYDLETGIYTQGLYFYQGRNGLRYQSKSAVARAIPNPVYVRSGNPNYDVGIILLDKNVGLSAGYLPIRYSQKSFEWNDTEKEYIQLGTIAGYPGDKLFGNMFMVPCFYRQKPFYFDRIRRSLSDKIEYECDTYGGMSGSALLAGDGLGGSVIIGVHTNGVGAGSTRNSGVLLLGDALAFVQSFLR